MALFVGAISGTSVDGLDLALIDISDSVISLMASATHDLPSDLKATLMALGQAQGDDLDRLGHADTALGVFIGKSINDFLVAQNVARADIHAIGSHGQTVRHRPTGSDPFTAQIGDPNHIAEATGITTVADFRRRDMAAGGQAAPLVPLFHQAILGDINESRVVLNIGGISNITLLRPGRPVSGFDTGPGNALLDAWAAEHLGKPYDAGGAWSAKGAVVPALLNACSADPYLELPPPKSTGREHYNLAWLHRQLPEGFRPPDVQRTLVEFTTQSITDALSRWAPESDRLLVCGGGRHNTFLMDRLNDLVGLPLDTTDAFGWNGDAIEAAAFAWLAHRRLEHLAGNAPDVTGARGERVLGGVYLG